MEGRRVETPLQETLVFVPPSFGLEIARETAYGHVRDRPEVVELDAVVLPEFQLVSFFEHRLRRGEKRSSRVVDQVEPVARTFLTVSRFVEELECADAPVIDAPPPLRVDVLLPVARK